MNRFTIPGILLTVLPYHFLQAQVALPPNYNTTTRVNYIRTWDAAAPEQNPATLITRPLKDVKQTTAYFDGLGRPLQTVVKQGSLATNPANLTSSAGATDMVSAITYDEFGREQYKYLPFAANNAGSNVSVNDGLFKVNPFEQQVQFYNNQLNEPGETNVGGTGRNWAYSKNIFEASPLSRLQEVFSPGSSWVGTASQANENDRHSAKSKYYFNTARDSVKIWTVTEVPNDFGTYSVAGEYAPNELHKTIVIDEEGKQSIDFRDKEGKVILTKTQHTSSPDDGSGKGYSGWLCTYYIYDELDQLRAVIQPRGIEHIAPAAFNAPTIALVLGGFCFRYEYDSRGRLIRKKVPDGGEMRMVYDARDRLVLSQDRNMRTGFKGWMYTQYDDLNRPVSTGFIPDLTNYENLNFHINAAWNSTHYPDLNNYAEEEYTRTFYDDYLWLGNYSTSLNATYNNAFDGYLMPPSSSAPYPQVNTPSQSLRGLITGTRIRVVGNTVSYLYAINIYDDKGRIIQRKATNITNGEDITTTQYAWNGQLLVSVQKRQKAGNNPQSHITITRMTYDDLERVVSVRKEVVGTINGQTISRPERVLVTHEYDALGQLKKKSLAPGQGSGGTPLETQVYDYNIRGWMLGSNRDYAKDTNSTTHRFGFDLAYDKKALSVNGLSDPYTNHLFNGNIAGMTWKSGGDNRVRRYDFSYDAVNRLTDAHFKQFTGSDFNLSAGVDFSMYGVSYDANGNILTMNQRGWKPGGSVTIDSLLYNYYSHSNKLLNIIDRVNDPNTRLGDFRASTLYTASLPNGKNNNTVDYTYEANGHLSTDRNKDLEAGVHYNQLQLVRYIAVKAPGGGDKGGITYTYDALGNKLKKEVQETGKPMRTTLYLGNALYENDTLQFISHEEGRLRFGKKQYTSGASGYHFHNDYFLRDHLGNVRMVLTEQTDTANYLASMEAAYRSKEDSLFYNIAGTSYPTTLVAGGYPTDGTTNPNDSLARTIGNGNKVGPALVLKVMSGDKVEIAVKSFYRSGGTANEGGNPITDILGSVAAGIVNIAGDSKGSFDALSNSLNSPLLGALNSFRTDNNPSQSSKPKAYLNWVLLDEQFNFVANSSGAKPVQNPNAIQPLTSDGPVNMTRNGYLFIYVSNETENWEVFFDNLAIQHITGPLAEETHYYPFGLAMAGISSKAIGKLENRFKFNGGVELNTQFDINLYETGFRSYDPQIGRFWQIDPLAHSIKELSPYNFASNDPISRNDPTGLKDTVVKGQSMHRDRDLDPVTVVAKKMNKKPTQHGTDYSALYSKDMNALKGALDDLRKVYLPKSVNRDIDKLMNPGVRMPLPRSALRLGVHLRKFQRLMNEFESLYLIMAQGTTNTYNPGLYALAGAVELAEAGSGGAVLALGTIVLDHQQEEYRQMSEDAIQRAHSNGLDELHRFLDSHNSKFGGKTGYGYAGFYLRRADLQKVTSAGFLSVGLEQGNIQTSMPEGNDVYFIYFRTSLLSNPVISVKDIGYLKAQ